MFFKKRKDLDRQAVDRETIRIFWRISIKYKRLFFLTLLFPLGMVLSGVMAPLFIGKTLGALAQGSTQSTEFFTYFCITLAIGLIFNRLGHPPLMELLSRGARDAQKLGVTTLLRRSIGFHNNSMSGKLVSDAIDFPVAYSKLYDVVTTACGTVGIPIIFGSIVVYFESWPLGLYLTFTTLIICGMGVYDSKRMAPRRQERMRASKDVTSHIADTITNIQAVKTFSHEPYELKEHSRLSGILQLIQLRDWREMSVRGNLRLFVLGFLQALLIFILIHQVQQRPELLGVGIFIFSFTVMLSSRLFEVNMLIRNIEEALLAAAPMTKIIREETEIKDRRGAKNLQATQGAITFSNVHFKYADEQGDDTIFSDLNFTIHPGEKIGLVGPSGGGKSTLVRLLLRFEDIQEGTISIDDQVISDITQHSLRDAISYVPQEPLLFHRSIRENIAYGNPEATLDEIKKAAKQANAAEFIDKLNSGYDTIVGERGVKLSGGQRQRIAIARAILKDAPILMLDEATSALDSESELLIQESLEKLMKDRTTIVIAHRLSTIQKMDRIIVLKDGVITEEGNHAQLLKHKGIYSSLWSHQSGGFLED